MEEVSEGAVFNNGVDDGVGGLLNSVSENTEFGGVGLPLWSELEVVFHSLMAEEHVIVAPERGNHSGGGHELANELLSAA